LSAPKEAKQREREKPEKRIHVSVPRKAAWFRQRNSDNLSARTQIARRLVQSDARNRARSADYQLITAMMDNRAHYCQPYQLPRFETRQCAQREET